MNLSTRDLITLFFISSILIGSSCATTPTSPHEAQKIAKHPIHPADLSDSSVDIVYILGHNQHRFTAEAHSGKVLVKSFLDKKVLNEGVVDSLKYYQFLNQASNFNEAANKTTQLDDASSHVSCRTPFTVTIRIRKDAKTHMGCRLSDNGYLSRLVRQGEFLLYSKK